jgi:ring-1,2-phenylacetyl-CoA epoxidase subunit PaaE
MTTQTFHALRVLDAYNPIATAKTVVFDVPNILKDTFRWRAGQHITLRFELNGEEVRRSYTVSSSPVSGEKLCITVKRVLGGLVSNYINDNVRAGDEIEVMSPFGGFCLDPDGKKRRTHYFFGAGSGITPLFSMLQSVLLAEPYSYAYLLYGNASENSIIFQQTLADLVEQYPERCVVRHVLSNRSVLTSFRPWRTGRIDTDAIWSFIEEQPPYAHDAQYYVCGPGNMNTSVKSALQDIDVPVTRIHSENFGGVVEMDNSFEGIAAKTTVILDGQSHEVHVARGQTLLQAMIAVDLNPPYSCQSGICGACRTKLMAGEVHMRARMALEDTEIEQGEILSCQSVAKTDKIAVVFD